MRKIVLQTNDYSLFDVELNQSDYEYFRGHMDTFKTMFVGQGENFWINFIRCFRWFHTEFGFIKTFPASSAEYGSLLERGFDYIIARCRSRKIQEVRNYVNDVAIMVRNKSHVHHLESKFNTKDPFYHKETREVYRKIFGEPNCRWARLKVYCQFDLHSKFAGALVQCLRRWRDSPEQDPSDAAYFSNCETKCDVDLIEHCAQPGADKLALDYGRYERELEASNLIYRKATNCHHPATRSLAEEGLTFKPSQTPETLIDNMDAAKKKELEEIATEFYKDYVPRDGSMEVTDGTHTVELVMYINERLQGREDGPVLIGSWPKHKDPRFHDAKNPLYDLDANRREDWRADLDYGKFLSFLNYVELNYGSWRVSIPENKQLWEKTEAPCISTVTSVMSDASSQSKKNGKTSPVSAAPADENDKPKENGTGKKKKSKKERKRDRLKREMEFVDVPSMPGFRRRRLPGMITEYHARDPATGEPVRFTQKIAVTSKFKRVEINYERDTEQGIEKRVLCHDYREYTEADAEKKVVELWANPTGMQDVTKKRVKTVYQTLPGTAEGMRSMTAKIREAPAVKELPVLNEEAERKIIESLARHMDLNTGTCSDMIDAATGQGHPSCTLEVVQQDELPDPRKPNREAHEFCRRKHAAEERRNNDKSCAKPDLITEANYHPLIGKYSDENTVGFIEDLELAAIVQKHSTSNGRYLAREIPAIASDLGIPVSDMPQLDVDENGKPMKTELHFHQVIKTLLSGDASRYIEVSSFSEPDTPDTKFYIMIPPDPNCTPGYRYFDPHRSRALNGTLRHELLLGIVKRHTLLLCPRDGEYERSLLMKYPDWKTRRAIHILDNPETYAKLSTSILNNTRMPVYDEELTWGACAKRERDAKNAIKTPIVTTSPSKLDNDQCTRHVEVEKKKTVSVKFSDLDSDAKVATIDTTMFPVEQITKGLLTSPVGRHFISKEDGDKMELQLNRESIDEVLKQSGAELMGAEVKFEVTYMSKKPVRSCANCGEEEPKPKTYKKCERCKKEKVSNPRYYCCKPCQLKDWKTKHRREHLEETS